MSTEGLLGGMWADREGYLDTTGTVHAYAKAARKRGAEYFEHTKVEALSKQKMVGKFKLIKGNNLRTCSKCRRIVG